MCLWWGWPPWAWVAWLGAVFGFLCVWRQTRRGAGDVVLRSGFGDAGTWLWGLGVQHVDVVGSREGWGSLWCLGALCLGSALVGFWLWC